MLVASWSGTIVKIFTDAKIHVRTIHARFPVVGVQISGDSTSDAVVAIAMNNGKTDVFKSSGAMVRKGL